ncbi:MAG: isochorismatase family cysteine hydrolase [Phycisphaerae bacterium]|jgi:nicotinamidase-related amidase
MTETSLDPRFVNVDPLREVYRESIVATPERFHRDHMERAALLCIDLQYLDAARGYGVFEDAEKSGVPIEAQEYYFDQLDRIVIPNVRRLQACFRRHGLEVIHIRIQSLTRDGRDRSSGHKRLGLHAAPGSKDAEFLEPVAPKGDEIVINKTTSGAFTSTILAYVLSNLDIRAIYVAGVYTDECISTTVRDACDLGYFTTLVSDGCTTVTPQRQEFTIGSLKDRYVRVVETSAIVTEIGSRLPAEGRTS